MTEKNMDQNYYELLDISPSATLDEVQQAYKEAKETYNGSNTALYTMFSREEAEQINILLDEAYKTLSHYARRRDYDESLREGHFEVLIEKEPSTERETKSFGESDTPKPPSSKLQSYQQDEIFEEEIRQQKTFDGSFLKKVREYKNVDLSILSERLKISKHHFIAIETNDFPSLPANVFVRNYVKQYAEAIGLDGVKASESYLKLLKEVREK